MIERKLKKVVKRRGKDEILAKHKKIGELLGMPLTPLHELAWKEWRLDLGSGDCYPLIDVIERIVELITQVGVWDETKVEVRSEPKKRGRKKVKEEDAV